MCASMREKAPTPRRPCQSLTNTKMVFVMHRAPTETIRTECKLRAGQFYMTRVIAPPNPTKGGGVIYTPAS